METESKEVRGTGEGKQKKEKNAGARMVREVGVMMKRDGDAREHVFWFIG